MRSEVLIPFLSSLTAVIAAGIAGYFAYRQVQAQGGTAVEVKRYELQDSAHKRLEEQFEMLLTEHRAMREELTKSRQSALDAHIACSEAISKLREELAIVKQQVRDYRSRADMIGNVEDPNAPWLHLDKPK